MKKKSQARAKFRKSKRGRMAGQLAKAHQDISEASEHIRRAAHGNFEHDVQEMAYLMTTLSKEMNEILSQSRSRLECSRASRRILMLDLPQGDSFTFAELERLRGTGLDAHWLLQKTDHLNNEPLLLLSRLLAVAKKPEAAARFFRELARRFEIASPADGPVEPLYSRLTELKALLGDSSQHEITTKRFPYLSDAHRHGVTVPQMRRFIEEFEKCPYDNRTLLRCAKTLSLKTASRGRPAK
jgi:hypothetical protein